LPDFSPYNPFPTQLSFARFDAVQISQEPSGDILAGMSRNGESDWSDHCVGGKRYQEMEGDEPSDQDNICKAGVIRYIPHHRSNLP